MKFRANVLAGALTGAVMLISSVGYSEDTEIFFSGSSVPGVRPNVLFIMDTSGSMADPPSGDTSTSKIDGMKSALTTVLDQARNVNIGLQRYSVPGGPILYPITNIDAAEVPRVSTATALSSDDAFESTSGAMTLNGTTIAMGANGGTASTQSWVGLRFSNLYIPQGVVIKRAVIGFVGAASENSSLTLAIYGHKIGDSPTFTSTSKNISDIAQRPRTTASVNNWTPGTWSDDEGYSSVDISAIVQELANQAGWCGGNSMSFMIANASTAATSNVRTTYAIDKKDSHSPALPVHKSPRLYVEFDMTSSTDVKFNGGATKCFKGTANVPVRSGLDDIEQLSTAATASNGTDIGLRLNKDGSSNAGAGFLFGNVQVPQGATITSAQLVLNKGLNHTPADSTTVGHYTIQAVSADNLGTWATTSAVTGAATTGTTIAWDPAGNVFDNSSTSTQVPVTQLVQDIVSRAGWLPGNGLGLLIKPGAGTRNDYINSYDKQAAKRAQLLISYTGTYVTGLYTARDELKRLVDQFEANQATPISDSMIEAGRYFRGELIDYGRTRGSSTNRRNRVTDARALQGTPTRTVNAGCILTAAGSPLNPNDSFCKNEAWPSGGSAPRYKSPIIDECVANHIAFMTDGLPNGSSSNTPTTYNTWSGGSCTPSDNDGNEDATDQCAIKIANYYAHNDQSKTGVGNNLANNQFITTDMIGFDTGTTGNAPVFLNAMATNGNGKYYLATDPATLVASLESILDSAESINSSFVSAGVTVNQVNHITNSDDLYFALFSPDTSQTWPGNLKKYKNTAAGLVDSTGALAVNSSGTFDSHAISYWSSPTVDGDNVVLGGAASHFTLSRNIYSNISGSTNVTLTSAGNAVKDSNSAVTMAMVGATSASERTNFLNWWNGADAFDADKDGNTTELVQRMGDPLHSKPALLTYKTGSTLSTRVFVATNYGMLHEFDSLTGVEDWSYIPKTLMLNMRSVITNPSGLYRVYGLDGSVSLYVNDLNGDGAVDKAAGESAYLYVGERRGGNHYYALDVSTPGAPVLKWIISGGSAGFTKLGQTWSTPTVMKTKIGGSPVTAIAFGGGYDTTQDYKGAGRQTATLGGAIYIVNADTGALLFSTEQSGIQTSDTDAGLVSTMGPVPGDIKFFDVNGDGYADAFYAVDTYGQIFRFDVSATGVVKGGRIAHIQKNLDADANVPANGRMFYYSPAVAFSYDNNGTPYVALAIGSGYREHPLDLTINDNFYLIRDKGVLKHDFYKDISLTELVNVTNIVGDSNHDGVSDATVAIESNNKLGWYIDFDDVGEKVLTSPRIVAGTVLFTTYLPTGSTGSTCQLDVTGSTRLWGVNITDGGPVIDIKNIGSIEKTDRYEDSTTLTGIPETTILFTDNGYQTCIGTDCSLANPFDALANGKARLKVTRWKHQTK